MVYGLVLLISTSLRTNNAQIVQNGPTTTKNTINRIQDSPDTSAMGTELLKDLVIRQEEFLKRIRKHPSNPDDANFTV